MSRGSAPMTSTKPYLLDAFYRWMNDNSLTPHLMIDAYFPGTEVPQEHVKDGQIVLNIAPSAVMHFSQDTAAISFSARFGGIPFQIYLPMGAIMGIFARENGRGMMFERETEPEPPTPGARKSAAPKSTKPPKQPSPARSHLRAVK